MVVSLQNMEGRNDEANNRYGLKKCKHSNRDDVLSINKQGSGDKEEEEKEEDVVDRPHQRLCVDDTNNEDPE